MKILLVDDHSLFREGLRHLLRGLAANATVLEVGSGSEALAAVGQNPDLDLILLDLSLPDLGHAASRVAAIAGWRLAAPVLSGHRPSTFNPTPLARLESLV